ncbi:Cytochrome P450 4B1 [Geodia barretti]|uniref:Cytochrome P450 4B1 n=1 Tax=Geodia barretti TaxID=519541 RepID=A0AA35RMD4_GEOBA|nr:Cytochrome P450 4B1 [Geodia barretti]
MRLGISRPPCYPLTGSWVNSENFGPDEHSLLRVNHYIHSKGYKATAGRLGPMVAIVSACHPDTVKPMLKEPKLRQVYDLLDPWLGKGLLTIEDGPKWHRNRHLLTPAFHYSILKGYVSVYNECLQQLFRKWDTSAKLNEPVLVFHTMKHACKVVHAHAEIIIKKRRNALGLEGSNKGLNPGSESQDIFNHITKSRHLDFLDILLTAVDDDGVGLTDTEIRNEVDTFMFEGHDTTTSGMSWTLYCLAKHPQHQEKVHEEVRRVLNGRESLEYEDLKELKYTQWCIKEAMRLYPPVILIFREASRDMEIDGIKVPKGVWLGIPTYHLHHNPTIWPDPEKFDPLRFEPSNAEGRDPYAYLAFSAGSRNCIGQNFAINEEKVVVASIVNRYRLSIVEDHVVEMLPVIVLRAKYDIKLHLEPLLD